MNEHPEKLIAEQLTSDTRIAQAKALIQETIQSYQKHITTIRPPLSSRKQSYQETLDAFASYRGAPLWFPYLGSGIGNGPLVELADGSVKYDFICGIGTHYWGHSHPKVIDACLNAAISDTVMQGHLQQNMSAVVLSKLLIDCSKMDHCFLTTSGAMANENALKMAFQNKFPANRILAFEHCFTGRTLALAQVTDKPSFREGLPQNIFVDYVPFFDPAAPEASIQAAVTTLKKHITRYPKQHAIMCLEMIQGEGGFNVGSHDFFKALIKILKENKITVLIDEVQSFGRTPELFAFQYFNLQEDVDIVTIGKLSLVCATLFKNEYKPRPGLLSQTFTASTSAIEASLALLQDLTTGSYFGPQGKISKLHTYFTHKLTDLANRYPQWIHGPFGIGTMIAFTPYDGDTQRTTQFVHRLFEAGVISFIAGSNPTRVRFLVPVGATKESDIDNVLKIIEKTLKEST